MKDGFSALVIDDDHFSRHTAVRILYQLGAASVVEAADGQEGLHHATENGAGLDLVVCDLKMPQFDGIETLRGLASKKLAALIILASGADARVLRSARDMASEFGIATLRTIPKPLTMQKLSAVFAEVDIVRSAPSTEAATRRVLFQISEHEIRRGLADGQFVPYFQPKVELASRRIAGAEALVRWIHPAYGVLSSRAFLSIAHEARLMDDILDVVLAKSAAHCAEWQKEGLELTVSVNTPIASLLSRDLPQRLESIVARAGLDPEHIMFEVTEDGWLQNHALAREILTRLRLRGFGLSIADFGTGYSTLQQLLQAPFNEMKVDQSFVRSVPEDQECAAALVSSIMLARRLGLTVVGEGIETAAQWQFLEQAGCDLGQGYFIARPMPGPGFTGWAAAWERQCAVSGSIPPMEPDRRVG